MTSILMASALAVASTAAIAKPKDRGGELSVSGTMLSIAFENRGDCQSATAKLRNGVRTLLPFSSSTENAVAKPLRSAICNGDVLSVDLAKQNLTLDEINLIKDFIEDNGGTVD
jgi:hypothetical protein